MARAHPVATRCRFVVGARRCRRQATVDGQLCAAHAGALMLEDDDADLSDSLFALLDRTLAGRVTQDQVTGVIASALGGALQSLFRQPLPPPPPPPRGAGQPRARPAPPRQPEPEPPAPPDPALRAREVLGFEAGEPLTRELVQNRKRALARVFHPDSGATNRAAMQRVLDAADVLLARL